MIWDPPSEQESTAPSPSFTSLHISSPYSGPASKMDISFLSRDSEIRECATAYTSLPIRQRPILSPPQQQLERLNIGDSFTRTQPAAEPRVKEDPRSPKVQLPSFHEHFGPILATASSPTSPRTKCPASSFPAAMSSVEVVSAAKRRGSDSSDQGDYVWTSQRPSPHLQPQLGPYVSLPSPAASDHEASRPSRHSVTYFTSHKPLHPAPPISARGGFAPINARPLIPSPEPSLDRSYTYPDPYSRFHAPIPYQRPPRYSPGALHRIQHGRVRKSRAPPADNARHNNKPYTLEQVDFIRYHDVDREQPWNDTVADFGKRWGPGRPKQGLQGVLYRSNKKVPKFDVYGNICLDSQGCMTFEERPVRAANGGGNGQKESLKLVVMFPERALKYAWVSDADKKKAAELKARYDRQITEHPANKGRSGDNIRYETMRDAGMPKLRLLDFESDSEEDEEGTGTQS